jgi:nicotinate-nucleotide adenylyltransferase
MTRDRIGIFGGSFDPPHYGHIHLVLSCIEYKKLTKVFIVPTKKQPLKEESSTPLDRFQMAKRAFEIFSVCEILDIELTRPGPSYTIDTLEWLLANNQSFREGERFLLCGADVVSDFPKWKDPEKVFSIVQPLVAARDGFFCERGEVATTSRLDISSTKIRERVLHGLYVGHLIPETVCEYIKEKGLYSA